MIFDGHFTYQGTRRGKSVIVNTYGGWFDSELRDSDQI